MEEEKYYRREGKKKEQKNRRYKEADGQEDETETRRSPYRTENGIPIDRKIA